MPLGKGNLAENKQKTGFYPFLPVENADIARL
jgi:hypothetical protein